MNGVVIKRLLDFHGVFLYSMRLAFEHGDIFFWNGKLGLASYMTCHESSQWTILFGLD